MRISVEQRRARLARRHHLASEARATDVATVARDLVGLHATDVTAVYLGAAARLKQPSIGAVDRALYDDRNVVRMLGMRRTMFVEPVELVPVVDAACTRAVAARIRARIERDIESFGIATDGAAWLRAAEQATLAALNERGEATGSQLAAAVPALREQMLVGEGKKWGGVQAMTTRVLTLLGAEGHIVRGRPLGTWTSTQHRWVPAAAWFGAEPARWPAAEARADLARRWLAAFGPASVADLRWWAGWSAAEVKGALAAVETADVDLDSGPGLVLAGDTAPVRAPRPWAALLPALDSTAMGWSERSWYLGPHAGALFDRSGNVGPTVWWNGRIVGGWAQRRDGEVVVRLLEDVGAEGVAAVEAEAVGVGAFVDGRGVIPRFRTPLERELSA